MTYHTDAHISSLAIAGYADERTLWLLLRDVAQQLRTLHAQGTTHGALDAQHVTVQGKTFFLVENTSADETAPASAPDDIWALGALVYRLALGCELFGGRGQKAQNADTPLPVLRNGWNELNRLVRRMLDCSPAMRPTAESIAHAAEEALSHPAVPHWQPQKSALAENALPTDELDRLWPEKF